MTVMTNSTSDILFMRRALELATLGSGQVSPNPMVGCVIVHQNKIIGEGWHKKYGDWHAEVNAVNAVEDKSLLKESTAYVMLEPCSHFGKTPPCADLLIKHQLKKVVICNVDSNPLVGGKGIQKLQQAGIDIQTGVLEKEGRELNRRFFTYMEKKRPYIILKWAETADGLVAREDYSSKWISNSISRTLVHSWRALEDAIMVGTQTALYDNPQLTVRDWSGTDPIRIIIDKSLRLPSSLHVFDKKVLTLCYNTIKTEKQDNLEFIKLADSPLFLEEIIQDLYARKIQSVIIEGGSKLLNSFIELRLWDEARVFKSSQVFIKGIAAPLLQSKLEHIQAVQDDTLFTYKNPYV
jgi:diaminohydroxyphosphoribosylaminopyrimidine deaminase/5-amino-6-(5-phosphoribosylamino)uracil reductase